MMRPSYCTWRQMHLESDSELPYYKPEVVQAALEKKTSDNSILRPITFANKSLSSAERRYSNIEREALGILHGLKKFHHYCFVREVSIITSQTTRSNLQERFSNAVSKNTTNSSQNTPIQNQYTNLDLIYS